MKFAVFCVGNRLMLDEGIGPAVYDELVACYEFSESVELLDVGCMSMKMIEYVRDFDFILTVDAVDGTDEDPGTLFRYQPEDMMRHNNAMQSLHDLKLIDLFDSAALLGYEAEGLCLGMQVENMSPAELTIGLTPRVYEAIPLLVDTVLAELTHRGVEIRAKSNGAVVKEGWHHVLSSE